MQKRPPWAWTKSAASSMEPATLRPRKAATAPSASSGKGWGQEERPWRFAWPRSRPARGCGGRGDVGPKGPIPRGGPVRRGEVVREAQKIEAPLRGLRGRWWLRRPAPCSCPNAGGVRRSTSPAWDRAQPRRRKRPLRPPEPPPLPPGQLEQAGKERRAHGRAGRGVRPGRVCGPRVSSAPPGRGRAGLLPSDRTGRPSPSPARRRG